MRSFFLFILFNLIIGVSHSFTQNKDNLIDLEKSRWQTYYSDKSPKDTVSNWFLPFNTKDRSDPKTLGTVSTFGSPRMSYYKGHIHTGLDCIPKPKSDTNYVYAMAEGIVCSIHLGDPHRTIVVKHILRDGKSIYTSYKHLGDIYVKTGDIVNKNTKLARLYTRKEAKKLGGNYDHLHLEIRKKFDDYGCASWLTMTKTELNKRFYDPLDFIRKNIKN